MDVWQPLTFPSTHSVLDTHSADYIGHFIEGMELIIAQFYSGETEVHGVGVSKMTQVESGRARIGTSVCLMC